jgi:hypothetical protein
MKKTDLAKILIIPQAGVLYNFVISAGSNYW